MKGQLIQHTLFGSEERVAISSFDALGGKNPNRPLRTGDPLFWWRKNLHAQFGGFDDVPDCWFLSVQSWQESYTHETSIMPRFWVMLGHAKTLRSKDYYLNQQDGGAYISQSVRNYIKMPTRLWYLQNLRRILDHEIQGEAWDAVSEILSLAELSYLEDGGVSPSRNWSLRACRFIGKSPDEGGFLIDGDGKDNVVPAWCDPRKGMGRP